MTEGIPDSDDPTDVGFWRPLRRLQDAMDAEIARLYAERGVDVRPRHTMPLIRLGRRGPMTIRRLAEATEVTHSAMSQTVASLRGDGLVTTRPGPDARTRVVELTEAGRELLPFLEAEWRATEEAIAELDAELPYSLTRVVADMAAALERRPFRDRIADRLPDAP
ncbi:MarR family winged helix-turn-helix transcriptional regulator [Prauserella rugosa]|uniref:DNA-binding MarR family transcriptional regulator n=1 Tax=Prauserella rugosa TaxID=43354 RepID=A0A660CDQ3_9PSEU|nr:MarR family transcriptional regulator [Prauserella rugosa]KID28772.1 transcriptional regulator [Prauserella sp. Am3]KMS84153.1 MarR family transcriptional regulator [Streptomyces regensis]TWH21670.1 DNA-binding MarR family transcriptional regulator [Prauserella rugosa]